MGLDSCMKCIKYTLFIFNFFFWLVGVVLLGFGLYLLIQPIVAAGQLMTDEDPFHAFRLTLIVLGSIIMLLGFLGCCGAILENKCMLLTFFILMTLVFLALVIAGLLYVFMYDKARDHIKDNFQKTLKDLLDKYEIDSTAHNTTDAIHYAFKCCGVDKGSADFTDKNIKKPASCNDPEEVACVARLESYIKDHWLTVIVVVFSVAAVTLIGMILSMLLCCALRDELYDY